MKRRPHPDGPAASPASLDTACLPATPKGRPQHAVRSLARAARLRETSADAGQCLPAGALPVPGSHAGWATSPQASRLRRALALALARPWQYAVLVGSLNLLQARLRGVVLTLLAAGAWMCSSAQPG
jgi:hypothetical protein